MLRGLFWGLIGGIVGMLIERSVRPRGFGYFVGRNLAGAGITAVAGTILVGVIGDMLEGFTLGAAGSFLGTLFLGPGWALGCTAGVAITYSFRKSGERGGWF
jgi:hypothetical protein